MRVNAEELDRDGGLQAELNRLADAVSRLVREHVDLAKTELRERGNTLAGGVALLLTALPFLLAALLILDAALVVVLAAIVSMPWALVLVSVLNLGIGLTLAQLGRRKLEPLRSGEGALSATRAELRADRKLLASMKRARAAPPRQAEQRET